MLFRSKRRPPPAAPAAEVVAAHARARLGERAAPDELRDRAASARHESALATADNRPQVAEALEQIAARYDSAAFLIDGLWTAGGHAEP